MKVAIVLALCVAYVAGELTVENCKCWSDYTAKATDDGKVSCHGNRVFALKPCNLPQAPKCTCEKEKVTSFLTDNEGTWCAISEKGTLVKKWKCENEADWAAYKVKLDEFEANRKDE